MSLFRKKINPFCSFAITLGPQYVERVFDSLLTLQGVKNVVQMPAAERFKLYLDYLQEKTSLAGHEQYRYIQFYRAYFFQLMANHSKQVEIIRHWQEKALCYYQNYLELTVNFDESIFYAEWQSGILQETLNYPWSLAEESMLKAHTVDPLRGEPLKAVIEHYIRAKEWRSAYAFSQTAVKDHFDRNPAASRRWFVDFDAYNWNVLNNHLTICYKLGYLVEAGKTYDRMMAYELHHLDEFKPSEMRHIHFLEKIFRDSERKLATA